MDWKRVEASLGYSFQNQLLLMEAFTHRSYLNENRNWPVGHNERLEFLGDAVIELIVTDFLYQKYPDKQEGQLTELRGKIVRTDSLVEVAKRLDFENYILLSKGERKSPDVRSRHRILGSTYEAVVAAIRLDSGYDVAAEFVIRTRLKDDLERLIQKELDHKSLLQERSQAILRVTPVYRVLDESGPDHNKRFVVGVFFGETLAAKGHGPAKQLAEEKAAEAAMILRGWKVSR